MKRYKISPCLQTKKCFRGQHEDTKRALCTSIVNGICIPEIRDSQIRQFKQHIYPSGKASGLMICWYSQHLPRKIASMLSVVPSAMQIPQWHTQTSPITPTNFISAIPSTMFQNSCSNEILNR